MQYGQVATASAAGAAVGTTTLAQTGFASGTYALMGAGLVVLGATLVSVAKMVRHKGARP